MSQEILESHESLVVEMATVCLDNMELELGRKYKDNTYEIDAGLKDEQYESLKSKHSISNAEFADIYTEFQKMKPTKHLQQAMDAFTKSGGNVEIEPEFDEEAGRLSVPVRFVIKDRVLEKIEGLSPIEDVILRVNAMFQIDSVLTDADPDALPEF